MKEQISELMDGELERAQSAAPLDALRDTGEARETWRTYHLIGDAMRDTRMLSGSFTARVAAALAAEPTVMAPVAVAPARPAVAERQWPALSIAASLAAFALVVGAVFVSQKEAVQAPQVASAPKPPVELIREAAQVAPPDTAHDYLLAHQGSSPRNSLQGMAPYVRMVSDQSRPAKP
jgi:sigma-E factor negative regulatory protein RseA